MIKDTVIASEHGHQYSVFRVSIYLDMEVQPDQNLYAIFINKFTPSTFENIVQKKHSAINEPIRPVLMFGMDSSHLCFV